MKYIKYTALILLLLLTSCGDSVRLEKLNAIKSVGDKNPVKAMRMLDSIQTEMNGASKYVTIKQIMLKMRLNDKANIIPTSDDDARTIIKYFDSHGTDNDKQEAHFYAGSTYRDLKDVPKALEHFLKSKSLAEGKQWCDSIMLRNTYSSLNALYYIVQDYDNALVTAKKEYEISSKVGPLSLIPIIHLGASYLHADSAECAYRVFCEALDTLKHMNVNDIAQRDVYALLYDFSFLKKRAEADYCYSLITNQKYVPTTAEECFLGEYYIFNHEIDSAIMCFRNVLKSSDDWMSKYDAATNIMYLHVLEKSDFGIMDDLKAFMEITDTVDMGKRQKMAATVNNIYQYHRNMMAEQKLIDEKEIYKLLGILSGCSLLTAIALLAYYHTKKKNKYLQELMHMSSEINILKSCHKKAKEELGALEKENSESRMALQDAKDRLKAVNTKFADYESAIKESQEKLEEKMAENKHLISLLHKADLEASAKNVIQVIRDASNGRHNMTFEDWQMFYHAVDELQPDLMERIMQHMKRFSEEQQQVCYLLSIGLTNTQIENLTGLPHSTVWRWVKRLDWV